MAKSYATMYTQSRKMQKVKLTETTSRREAYQYIYKQIDEHVEAIVAQACERDVGTAHQKSQLLVVDNELDAAAAAFDIIKVARRWQLPSARNFPAHERVYMDVLPVWLRAAPRVQQITKIM